MESCTACQVDPRALYETAMARRSQDRQKTEGQAAVRLIEGAGAAPAPLPPDATISVRA